MFTTQVEGEQYHSDSFESNITDSRNTEPIKIELNLQRVTQSSKIAESPPMENVFMRILSRRGMCGMHPGSHSVLHK